MRNKGVSRIVLDRTTGYADLPRHDQPHHGRNDPRPSGRHRLLGAVSLTWSKPNGLQTPARSAEVVSSSERRKGRLRLSLSPNGWPALLSIGRLDNARGERFQCGVRHGTCDSVIGRAADSVCRLSGRISVVGSSLPRAAEGTPKGGGAHENRGPTLHLAGGGSATSDRWPQDFGEEFKRSRRRSARGRIASTNASIGRPPTGAVDHDE